MNIAILGSNSLIAKDFIQNISLNENNLYLFSRKKYANHFAYDTFLDHDYDLVINFIGGADPKGFIDNHRFFFDCILPVENRVYRANTYTSTKPCLYNL